MHVHEEIQRFQHDDPADSELNEFGASSGAFSAEVGWREASVTLHLPKERHTHSFDADSPKFTSNNVWGRRLNEFIAGGYRDAVSCKFHWFPFHFLHRVQHDRSTHSARIYTAREILSRTHHRENRHQQCNMSCIIPCVRTPHH